MGSCACPKTSHLLVRYIYLLINLFIINDNLLILLIEQSIN